MGLGASLHPSIPTDRFSEVQIEFLILSRKDTVGIFDTF